MKKPEPATKATQQKWESLALILAERGVQLSAMFGMPALKFNGKAFGGLFGDAVVLKLQGDAHARAIGLKGAVLFDPSGMGRPMKEWVVLPAANHKSWDALAVAALESLSASLKKAAAPKKKPAKR